jgi:hypothetical protein
MTIDKYPTAESKTPQTDALKNRLIESSYKGTLSELLNTMVPAEYLHEINDVINSVESSFAKISEILKPSANSEVVRWIEQGSMPELTEEQQQLIYKLADEFGLRLPVDHELPKVDNPLIIIESGANKTSVVRRGLGEEMLGEDGGTMYQFGSERVIAPTRVDKSGNEVENAEYKVVSSEDVCGDLEGRQVTEYEVNVLSALNNGYTVIDDSHDSHIILGKDGTTRLVIVRAASFKDGLSKLVVTGVLEDRNIVVATNGQYRTKDIIDTEAVVAESGVKVESITAIGDETGKRDAKIYSAELAVILKKLSK